MFLTQSPFGLCFGPGAAFGGEWAPDKVGPWDPAPPGSASGRMVHIIDVTMIISLLRPAPESYEIFVDIILRVPVVYQGPHENVLDFSCTWVLSSHKGKELLTSSRSYI